jgi:hypothetical protein
MQPEAHQKGAVPTVVPGWSTHRANEVCAREALARGVALREGDEQFELVAALVFEHRFVATADRLGLSAGASEELGPLRGRQPEEGASGSSHHEEPRSRHHEHDREHAGE